MKLFSISGIKDDIKRFERKYKKYYPNIRIIFSFWKSYVILLCAFLEKEKGDYDKAINSAKKRFKNIVEHL